MSVDPTRLLPVVPIADLPTPTASPGAADDAGSFSKVLSSGERPTRSDKSSRDKGSRDKANSWRENKPIEKVFPKAAEPATGSTPATESQVSEQMVNPDAQTPVATPVVPEEAATETQTATNEAAVQAAVIAATIVAPPTPPTTAPQTTTVTGTLVNSDSVPVNPEAAIPTTVVPPVPTVPSRPPVAPVIPQVVAPPPTTPTAVPAVSANTPQPRQAYCSQPEEPAPPSIPSDPVAAVEEPQRIVPQAEAPPAENPASTTAEAEQVEAAAPIEKTLPKAEEKDDSEDRPESERKEEVEVTAATEALPQPTVAETNTAARGERATETLPPPPDTAAQASPAGDVPPPADAQPTVSAVTETSAPRFPPGLTGRASAAREANARPEVDTNRFLRRVVGAFQAAEERGGDVKLRLRPPELGVVQIQVKILDGALTARMEAETPAARNLLLDNLPQLRERLAEQGLRIEKFEVNVSDRQSGGMPDPGPQSREQSQPHTPRPSAPRSAVREEAAARPPRVGPDPTGLNVLV